MYLFRLKFHTTHPLIFESESQLLDTQTVTGRRLKMMMTEARDPFIAKAALILDPARKRIPSEVNRQVALKHRDTESQVQQRGSE